MDFALKTKAAPNRAKFSETERQNLFRQFESISPDLGERLGYFLGVTKNYPHVLRGLQSFSETVQEGRRQNPNFPARNYAILFLDGHEGLPGLVRHVDDTATIATNTLLLYHEKLGIPARDLPRQASNLRLAAYPHDTGKKFGGQAMTELKLWEKSKTIQTACSLPSEELESILSRALADPDLIEQILEVAERVHSKPEILELAPRFQLKDSPEILESLERLWSTLFFDADWPNVGQEELCRVVKQHASISGQLLRDIGCPPEIWQPVERHHLPYSQTGNGTQELIIQHLLAGSDVLSALMSRKNDSSTGRKDQRRGTKEALMETFLCQNTQLHPKVVGAWLDSAKALFMDKELVIKFYRGHKGKLEIGNNYADFAKKLVNGIEEEWPSVFGGAEPQLIDLVTKTLAQKLEEEFSQSREFELKIGQPEAASRPAIGIETTHTPLDICKRVTLATRNALSMVFRRETVRPALDLAN